MQILDYKNVLVVAEELIEKNGSTTTLDVKNLLRQRNFQASQNEVSSFMNQISARESWQSTQNSNFKVYSFGVDSNQVLDAYLTNSTHFWAIKVEKGKVLIEEGLLHSTGVFTEHNFNRNKKAIRKANDWIEEKEKNAFFKTPDTRLPFNIRKSIAGYENKKIKKIILSFFNVIFKMTENIIIKKDDSEQIKATFITEKQGGYQFAWEKNIKEIEKITKTSNKNLEISQFQFDYYQTTGEKINHKNIVDKDGNNYQNPTIITNLDTKNHILIDLKNLYIAELFFETGEKLNLSKFDYKDVDIFLQVIRSFEI
ncbi:MAG: hypothetical protein EAZ85_04230 [Bacteroidetes bacterium]|nr:MAG: hypothetical protein EAZ85_04230 [Bacteroidota bacterium]